MIFFMEVPLVISALNILKYLKWVVDNSNFVASVFDLSFVTYFPAYTDVNGIAQPNCADVPLRIYSLTPSLVTVTVCG